MRYLTIYFSSILILTLLIGGCIENSSGPDFDDDSYAHDENPGLSANDFLSDETFSHLEVEIDYMTGFAPDQDALANLRAFLDLRLNKTSVTLMEPTEISADGQSSYTANEIRDLEEEHRDHYTQKEDSTLRAYMIIVDGSFEDGSVLGIAYYNTSSAFFGATYDRVSGPSLNQPSRSLTESVSFRHEFGHLLGLVNVPGSGTDMQTDHQDDEHGNHCTDESCLMYYAMENSGLFDRFLGEEIPSLDENCIADIRANDGE
jgi:hypothetical protein